MREILETFVVSLIGSLLLIFFIWMFLNYPSLVIAYLLGVITVIFINLRRL